MKTNSLKKKQHVLRTFQFWQISLYPDLTGVPLFMVDFLKYWKYPSNCSETFKMLFFHENKQFEEKKGKFRGPFNFDQNRCIRALPARPLFCWFFCWFFEMLKIPFQFFWKIPNCVLSSKQSIWSKKSMFCVLFNFDQNRCIRTLPAWRFFWFIFWNVENTFPILLKNSKFCSFMKSLSLKEKQHVLRTFQFWPKSLYPDLTGVAIFLVDFLKCWKDPTNSSETFKMLFFHEDKQFEEKKAILGTFLFWPKSLYPDLTGVAIFLVDFLKCGKYPSNSSEKSKILFFHQNNQFEAKTACFADF